MVPRNSKLIHSIFATKQNGTRLNVHVHVHVFFFRSGQGGCAARAGFPENLISPRENKQAQGQLRRDKDTDQGVTGAGLRQDVLHRLRRVVLPPTMLSVLEAHTDRASHIRGGNGPRLAILAVAGIAPAAAAAAADRRPVATATGFLSDDIKQEFP